MRSEALREKSGNAIFHFTDDFFEMMVKPKTQMDLKVIISEINDFKSFQSAHWV
jgi:hypothetical protein